VADPADNPLDGNHDGRAGGDFVRPFDRRTTAGKADDLTAAHATPSRIRMRGFHPSARRAAIPSAPGHRESRT